MIVTKGITLFVIMKHASQEHFYKKNYSCRDAASLQFVTGKKQFKNMHRSDEIKEQPHELVIRLADLLPGFRPTDGDQPCRMRTKY